MIEMALVENIQRENLNDIEQAFAFQRLMLECGLSHEELAKRVGKSRSAVTNTLRLLKLPEELQQSLMRGEITMGHARALLSIENVQQQKELGEKIVSQKLSVREVEEATQQDKVHAAHAKNGRKKVDQGKPDPNLTDIIDKLQHKFGTMITIPKSQSQKGKVEIQFFDESDFNRIIEILLRN
jgi:ParB family chromosome partitioning protein